MPRDSGSFGRRRCCMSKSKKAVEGYEDLHGKGLDLALDYIEKEIRKLDVRKDELESMMDRLMARQELFERERPRPNF